MATASDDLRRQILVRIIADSQEQSGINCPPARQSRCRRPPLHMGNRDIAYTVKALAHFVRINHRQSVRMCVSTRKISMTGVDRGVCESVAARRRLHPVAGSPPSAVAQWFKIGALLLLAFASACAPFKHREPYTPVSALAPTEYGPIADRVAALKLVPGQSSYRLLQSNSASLLLLMRTADAAVRSLDLMYYSWHDDVSGRLLAAELLRAADRGVRVRLIVDDVSVRHLDADLAVLDTHPNLEIRHYNPFRSRASLFGNAMEMIFTWGRPSYRMHQKAWIVDGHVAMVGGRNIGDSYFDLAQDFNFRDLGVLVTGEAVRESTEAFDEYWNSPLVIPSNVIYDKELTVTLADAQAALERERSEILSQSPLRELIASTRTGERRTVGVDDRIGDGAIMITDPANKSVLPKEPLVGVAATIRSMGDNAQSEVIIVSPYFVPGKKGARWLAGLEARGVQVKVLTNSLNATDVAAVHGGYMRYRKRLLRDGVEIHELKPSAFAPAPDETMGLRSRSSLHTKAVIVDGRHALVGSFNFDPRSTWLNTEMSVLIQDPEFAADVSGNYHAALDPKLSYRLELDGNRLVWIDEKDGQERRQIKEPSSSWKRKTLAFLARVLPVESQL